MLAVLVQYWFELVLIVKWVPSNAMKSIIKIVSLGFLILFIDFFNVFHEDDGNVQAFQRVISEIVVEGTKRVDPQQSFLWPNSIGRSI